MKINIEERAQAETLTTLKSYLEAIGEFKQEIKIKDLLKYINKEEKEWTKALHKIYGQSELDFISED